MKKMLISVLIILFSTLFIAAVPTETEAAIYEDTVRLHILAPSDSDTDQALKLKIRDKLLEKYSSELSEGSINAAKQKILMNIAQIERDVNTWILEEGFPYSAKAALTEEWYDTRVYESFTLPAGVYTSLKIVIGEGEGKNWWCVMYPPLCLDVATSDSTPEYTKDELSLITKSGYRVKFKLLEAASYIFGKK